MSDVEDGPEDAHSTSVHAALKSKDFEVRFVEGGLAAWDALGFGKGE